MPPKVNIIGAGIAGLSAGCYLQMNGFETEIFELHNLPGGLCTSWERKGFTIDGCIHWLVGSSPADPIYALWNELVDMKKIVFVDAEVFFEVEDTQGNIIHAYTDVTRLEQELLSKAPEDKGLIDAFIRDIRKLLKLDMPVDKAREVMNAWDGITTMTAFLPYLGIMKRWSKVSAGEYGAQCKNPLLRKFFEFSFLPDMTMLFILFTFVWMHKKSAGYPLGGSLSFSRQIEQRYLNLGGKISYHHRIRKIHTTENNGKSRATALEDTKGGIYPADYIVSAADGYSTLFEMLEGKFMDGKLRSVYQDFQVFPSTILVSLGINRDLKEFSQMVYLPLQKPLVVDPSISFDYLGYKLYSHDPTLAPEGKTMLVAMLGTYNYAYWVNLKKENPDGYKAEKQRIADEVTDALDHRLGGIKNDIDMVDVTTPSTLIRYTNNWKGSFEGWIMTKETGLQGIKKTVPGLDHFYMCGQWVEPGGGLPTALMSGRNVAQIICKQEKKKFQTESF